MAFRLLFDEMAEAAVADYCRKLGHDVERVVAVSDLGTGTDDGEIVAYAVRETRILVTYDDDFLGGHEALDRIGVLFGRDDRMPPMKVASVVDAIASHMDHQQIVDHDEPVHLTTEWL